METLVEQPVRRVGVLSVHSSPLAPPGVGDSGGMNVTIRALAGEGWGRHRVRPLHQGHLPDDPPVVEVEPGVRVLHLPAGPLAPPQAAPVPLPVRLPLLAAAGRRAPRPYDVLHSHYWVSGWVARLARERWDSPVAHSFHTLGRVKNLSLADGDLPEPPARLAGEERVVAAADCLLAPTPAEARQLVELYGASPAKVQIVPHGVDRTRFHPGDKAAARPPSGSPTATCSRSSAALQPLKAPDVAVLALAEPAAGGPTWTPSCWWSAGPRATAAASRPAWPGWPRPAGSPTGSGSSRHSPTTAWPPSTGRPTWS